MFRTSASTLRRSLVATAFNKTNFAVKSSYGSCNQISKSALRQCAIRWSSTDTKEPIAEKVETKEPSAKKEPEVDDLGDVIPPEITAEEKILTLEKEIRDLKDRVVRSLAEEENVSFSSTPIIRRYAMFAFQLVYCQSSYYCQRHQYEQKHVKQIFDPLHLFLGRRLIQLAVVSD